MMETMRINKHDLLMILIDLIVILLTLLIPSLLL